MFFKKKDEGTDSTAKVGGGSTGGSVTAPAAKATSSDAKIQETINKIYADANWLKIITEKAATNGKTVAEQVLDDAKWVNK
jgi:hypothetical protein